MANRSLLISGRLVLDRPRTLPPACRVHVEIIDARLADMPHRLIAAVEIDRAALPVEVAEIPFRVPVTLPDSGPPCLISAHVDIDGDGRIGRGDLITMESYPIEPSAGTVDYAIRVRQV